MFKHKLTWLDGRITEHETEKSAKDLIADMSVGAGYHIGDCLSGCTTEEIVPEPAAEAPASPETAPKTPETAPESAETSPGEPGAAEPAESSTADAPAAA